MSSESKETDEENSPERQANPRRVFIGSLVDKVQGAGRPIEGRGFGPIRRAYSTEQSAYNILAHIGKNDLPPGTKVSANELQKRMKDTRQNTTDGLHILDGTGAVTYDNGGWTVKEVPAEVEYGRDPGLGVIEGLKEKIDKVREGDESEAAVKRSAFTSGEAAAVDIYNALQSDDFPSSFTDKDLNESLGHPKTAVRNGAHLLYGAGVVEPRGEASAKKWYVKGREEEES
jgi:hypothetical protein